MALSLTRVGRLDETFFLVTAASCGLAISTGTADAFVDGRHTVLVGVAHTRVARSHTILVGMAGARVVRGHTILVGMADARVVRGHTILVGMAETRVHRRHTVLVGVADAAPHAARGRRFRRPASRRRSVVATAEIEKGKATTTTIAEIEE